MPLSAMFDGRIERKQDKKAQAKIAKMRDPVRGTATVVSSSSPLDGMGDSSPPSWTHYSVTCVVQAEGVPAQSVHQGGFGPTNRWPYAQMVLPITVDRADANNFVVLWGEVPTAQQAHTADAETLAAAMRGEPAGAGGLGGIAGLGGVTVVDPQGDRVQREQILAELRNQGIDMDARSRPGSDAPGSGAGRDDQLTRLQQLGELHSSGVLNDAEFEAQKAKILGET